MTKDTGIEVSMDAISPEGSIFLQSSSIFQRNPQGTMFPSPKEVRSAHQKSMHDNKALDSQAPHIVRYPSLGLHVRYSQRVRLNEAQALWLANHHLGTSFVAPEIYGWRKDGADTFLFMELIEGQPLDEVWGSLPEADRQEICKELRVATSKLGTLRQAKGYTFLGGGWDDLRGPGRLSDDYSIRLAHGDLHRSNIIVQRDSNRKWKLSGIVDWEMCSWMPENWDYCRARWPLSPEDNVAFGEVYMPYVFNGRSADYTNMYKYWHFFMDRLDV
ncbi:hypothetical protein VMCG_01852 [Cytospora schulzeri]|uniref:Aminoglycoside phosphotransferase domain-containing protein n=1 Tax=Cytospora schulzeri TaxID=448051 RepID=A0A423X2Y1_9PEZI|nr:hypothetical protein VMCG_01852 [Valsa malicola]